jgi:flagellar biosynthesis regulator FlaF
MTVTPPRPRATDPVLPPAIDMDSFRHVTAALTGCATDAAPAASDPAGGAERNKRLARAIHANMELWGAVLHAVIRGASGLPQPLRDHLVELAEVSIRHGSHVLRGDAAVDPLIAVNRSIIEGLQLSGGKQATVACR